MEICSKKECTGCFACINICPKDCIEMIEDSFGAIYPLVNEQKCINCNMCKRVCPSVNLLNNKSIKKAIACFSKNYEVRKLSSSGGVANELSKSIINEGGIVYSVTVNNDIDVLFSRAETIDSVDKFRGSKYVHSKVNYTFRSVKKDLEIGLKVLFIGLPCQIAGLKGYLIKEYPNLITIDLICHGVPTLKLLHEEVNLHNVKDINNITFRDQYGWNFKLYEDDELIFEENPSENLYFSSFLKGYIYRENCYSCKYANHKRVSDITIGDFWGLGSDSKFSDEEDYGVSVVLPSTDKGIEFLKQNLNKFNYEERSIEEAIRGNSQLNHPTIKDRKYYKFRKNYLNYGYYKAMKKCIGLEIQIFKLKRIIKKIIK